MSLMCIVYTTGNDIDLRLLAFIYLQLFALTVDFLPYQGFLRSQIGLCYENGNYHDISRVYLTYPKHFAYGFSMSVLKSLNSMYIKVHPGRI